LATGGGESRAQWAVIGECSAGTKVPSTTPRRQWRTVPPFTARQAPVICDARCEAKKATASATSVAIVILPHGMSPAICSMSVSLRSDHGVTVHPGATQLALIPYGPSSIAMDRVNATTPALAAEYTGSIGAPLDTDFFSAWPDAMLTITPLRCSI